MTTEDLVVLAWHDATDPSRDGQIVTPRARAELLVEQWEARHGDRYELEVFPWRPPAAATAPEKGMLTWLALLESGLGFAAKWWWAIAGAILAILAILAVYLPQAHWRAYPAVALGLVALATGFALGKNDKA